MAAVAQETSDFWTTRIDDQRGVAVADVGNMAAPITYAVTVAHP